MAVSDAETARTVAAVGSSMEMLVEKIAEVAEKFPDERMTGTELAQAIREGFGNVGDALAREYVAQLSKRDDA